ncbi:MAG TPA: hypothetical protein VGN76_16155 [Gemmatimonadales bacterium]|nr:hypothetical protein [Gemmatimonadales bacterium]
MPASIRVLLVATALAGVLSPAPARAQASPYIPLDDPRLPLLEHLIARGEVEDPSPMMRPFRRADAVRVLAAADTSASSPDTGLIRRLRGEFADPPGNSWRLEARAGAQAYTHGRRDLLHPTGAGRVRPFAELGGSAVFANVVVATRPMAEPALLDDPDWGGRTDLKFTGRIADAYISAQFKYGSLFYGQMDRNWGPVGLPGIPLSNYGYEHQGLALEIGNQDIRLSAFATDLLDEIDSLGQTVHRYYFVHRLDARPSRRLTLGIWEGVVLAGADRNFETRYRNPLSITYLATTIGLGDRGNVILGTDIHWRAFRRTTFQAQLALDDFSYQDRSGPNRAPDRWALTLSAFGPLGSALAWRAFYTQASSLAFRTFNPFENFTDHGVGLGRNFADMDQLTVSVSLPVATRWLLSPDLTVLRQGEGAINAPYPAAPVELSQTPQLFIGVVEKTYRLGLGLHGRQGPLDLAADAGLHHITNWQHVAGQTTDRFEGRVQVTLGLSREGTLR